MLGDVNDMSLNITGLQLTKEESHYSGPGLIVRSIDDTIFLFARKWNIYLNLHINYIDDGSLFDEKRNMLRLGSSSVYLAMCEIKRRADPIFFLILLNSNKST